MTQSQAAPLKTTLTRSPVAPSTRPQPTDRVRSWIGLYFDDDGLTWVVQDLRFDDEYGDLAVFFAVYRVDDDSDDSDDDDDDDDVSAHSDQWEWSPIQLFSSNFARRLRKHPRKNERSPIWSSVPGLRLRYKRNHTNLEGGGELLITVIWQQLTIDDLGGRNLHRAFI
jgi:hypothetical protein